MGREIWRIGDWGGASGHIGRRWEQLGAAALRALVGKPSPSQTRFTPQAAVSFVHSSCEQAIQAAGLTHADAVLVGSIEQRAAFQPVDFKWSLEVARPRQVSAETFQALLEADLPPVRKALAAALDAQDVGDGNIVLTELHRLVLLDGLFLSPDHAANRGYLDSHGNRRQEQPIQQNLVVLEPVDGPTSSPLCRAGTWRSSSPLARGLGAA